MITGVPLSLMNMGPLSQSQINRNYLYQLQSSNPLNDSNPTLVTRINSEYVIQNQYEYDRNLSLSLLPSNQLINTNLNKNIQYQQLQQQEQYEQQQQQQQLQLQLRQQHEQQQKQLQHEQLQREQQQYEQLQHEQQQYEQQQKQQKREQQRQYELQQKQLQHEQQKLRLQQQQHQVLQQQMRFSLLQNPLLSSLSPSPTRVPILSINPYESPNYNQNNKNFQSNNTIIENEENYGNTNSIKNVTDEIMKGKNGTDNRSSGNRNTNNAHFSQKDLHENDENDNDEMLSISSRLPMGPGTLTGTGPGTGTLTGTGPGTGTLTGTGPGTGTLTGTGPGSGTLTGTGPGSGTLSGTGPGTGTLTGTGPETGTLTGMNGLSDSESDFENPFIFNCSTDSYIHYNTDIINSFNSTDIDDQIDTKSVFEIELKSELLLLNPKLSFNFQSESLLRSKSESGTTGTDSEFTILSNKFSRSSSTVNSTSSLLQDFDLRLSPEFFSVSNVDSKYGLLGLVDVLRMADKVRLLTETLTSYE